MNWSDVRILYGRELRSALRERSIVVNSVLLPIFLYPVILWLMFTGLTFVQGLNEGFTSRVALFGEAPGAAEVVDSLHAMDGVQVFDGFEDPEAADAAVQAGELDAVLELAPAPTGPHAGVEGDFVATIRYDRSESRSQGARSRLEGVIDRHRTRWIEDQGGRLGITPEERTLYRVERVNVASGGEIGAFLLSQMVPLFLVIMVALGCFVPAIDSTAGERERSTWETLMSVSASRSSVVASKYLYVATVGTAAGILNVTAMTVSMGVVVAPLLGDSASAVQFRFPVSAVPVMMAGAVVLALFFAAAMMILASFARTFKDGQSMITPVYWLALIPVFLGQDPDQNLTARWALVPIANVALMIRDAINGIFSWGYIGISLAVGLVLVALSLAAARWILSFEDFLLGSFDGSFWKFIKDRPSWRRSAPAGDAK